MVSINGTARAIRPESSGPDVSFAQSSGSIPLGGKSTRGLTPAVYRGPPARTADIFPATSPSKNRMTVSDSRFNVRAWLSVRDVPHVAKTLRTPLCHRPMRSMYPSTTSTFFSFRMTGKAWNSPYNRELFR
jgi:hypothetical protein